MKSNNNYSEGYANYLKNIKREKGIASDCVTDEE